MVSDDFPSQTVKKLPPPIPPLPPLSPNTNTNTDINTNTNTNTGTSKDSIEEYSDISSEMESKIYELNKTITHLKKENGVLFEEIGVFMDNEGKMVRRIKLLEQKLGVSIGDGVGVGVGMDMKGWNEAELKAQITQFMFQIEKLQKYNDDLRNKEKEREREFNELKNFNKYYESEMSEMKMKIDVYEDRIQTLLEEKYFYKKENMQLMEEKVETRLQKKLKPNGNQLSLKEEKEQPIKKENQTNLKNTQKKQIKREIKRIRERGRGEGRKRGKVGIKEIIRKQQLMYKKLVFSKMNQNLTEKKDTSNITSNEVGLLA